MTGSPRSAVIRIEGSVTVSEGLAGIRLAHLRELVLAAEGFPEDSPVEFPIGGGDWRCPPEVRVIREPEVKPADTPGGIVVNGGGHGSLSAQQAEDLRHSIRRLGGR